MNRDRAEKIIVALNVIEAQRKDQDGEYLTEQQSKAELALTTMLQSEGFEFTYNFSEDTYSITAQTAYNWNF